MFWIHLRESAGGCGILWEPRRIHRPAALRHPHLSTERACDNMYLLDGSLNIFALHQSNESTCTHNNSWTPKPHQCTVIQLRILLFSRSNLHYVGVFEKKTKCNQIKKSISHSRLAISHQLCVVWNKSAQTFWHRHFGWASLFAFIFFKFFFFIWGGGGVHVHHGGTGTISHSLFFLKIHLAFLPDVFFSGFPFVLWHQQSANAGFSASACRTADRKPRPLSQESGPCDLRPSFQRS